MLHASIDIYAAMSEPRLHLSGPSGSARYAGQAVRMNLIKKIIKSMDYAHWRTAYGKIYGPAAGRPVAAV